MNQSDRKLTYWEIICLLFSWRMLVMFLLGFMSGFPFYVVKDVLKAWMSDSGVSLEVIGLFSLVSLPYVWKFAWSPVMDAIVPPFLGRRRGWILISQIGLMISIALMGQFNPHNQLWFIAITAMVVAFFSASQDIALDAFRREYLKVEEMGFGTSVWMNAWRLGMYVAVGAAFLAADSNFSWNVIYIMLSLVVLIGVVTVMVVPEPQVNAAPPRTFQEAVIDPFKDFLKRDKAFLILAFIFLYKVGDNMASAMIIAFLTKPIPALKEIFYITKTEYFVIVKGLGIPGMFTGAVIGGAIMARTGIARSLWVFGVLQAISTLGFGYIALHDPQGAYWVEHRKLILSVIVTFEFVTSGMGQAAYGSYMLIQSRKRYSATQLALLTSFMALPGTLAASVTGFMAAGMGWPGFFVSCALAAIPGMILLGWVAPWSAKNSDLDIEQH